MHLLDETAGILDENMVTYRHLMIDASNYSRHHIITDKERVFIKVLKPDGDYKKLKSEVLFSMKTLYGTNPLLEVTEFPTRSSGPLRLSAWEWENRRPLGRDMTTTQAVEGAKELLKIHRSRMYPGITTGWEDELQEYGEKFTSHSFSYLPADLQQNLKQLFIEIIQPATELLALTEYSNVVCHGQVSTEKLMMKDNRTVFWSDYEEARSAPKEYDLAGFYASTVIQGKRPDLWEAFLHTYQQETGKPVNQKLFTEFVKLNVARKALTIASRTLYATREEDLRSYLQTIEWVYTQPPLNTPTL